MGASAQERKALRFGKAIRCSKMPPHNPSQGHERQAGRDTASRPALSLRGSRCHRPVQVQLRSGSSRGGWGPRGIGSSQVQTTAPPEPGQGRQCEAGAPCPHGDQRVTVARGPYLRKVACLWQEARGGGGRSVAGVRAGLAGDEGGGAHELAAGRPGRRAPSG